MQNHLKLIKLSLLSYMDSALTVQRIEMKGDIYCVITMIMYFFIFGPNMKTWHKKWVCGHGLKWQRYAVWIVWAFDMGCWIQYVANIYTIHILKHWLCGDRIVICRIPHQREINVRANIITISTQQPGHTSDVYVIYGVKYTYILYIEVVKPRCSHIRNLGHYW